MGEEFFFTWAVRTVNNALNLKAVMNDTVSGTAPGAVRAPEGRGERESGGDGERRRSSRRHQLSSRSSYASSGESRRDMRRSRRERRKTVVFWTLLVMLVGVLVVPFAGCEENVFSYRSDPLFAVDSNLISHVEVAA